MSPESITTFIIASSLLALAPGPDNIFVLTQSALYGKRSGIIITLGLCTGLIVHTSAVALGVAAIFLVSAGAFIVLKLIGAVYLLYLAWLAFRATSTPLDKNGNSTVPGISSLYRRGILMNLSNPKIAIFFLAFLPQFTNPESGNMTYQLLTLGCIFILITLIIFMLIASLAGFIAEFFKQSARAHVLLNRIAALVFISLALRLATSSR